MIDFLFFVAAFISEIIGTIAGFGSSTIFLPIALFFVDFKTALILVALTHIAGGLGRLTFFSQGFDKKLALAFGVPSVLLALAGALLVSYLPQELLKLILGIFLMLFSVNSFFKPDFKLPLNTANAVFGGALSGFLAGLIGTGGAIRGAFLNAFSLPKEKYVATAALISLAIDFTRIPVYFANGFLEEQFYYAVPLLFILAIAGSFAGKKLVDRVQQKTFRKLIQFAIAIVSLKFIVEGLFFLFL